MDEKEEEIAALREDIIVLSEALRDIYNDVGEDKTVKRIFNSVYEIVKEYA